MNEILLRLESLFNERIALTERYASLWAVHGGGSQTWEHHLLDIETAAIKATIRQRLTAKSRIPKEAEIKEALVTVPEYAARVRQTIEDRKDWALVREQMTTLTWRIQLELAKLRLQLGDDPASADVLLSDS